MMMNEMYYQMYLDELKGIKPCDDAERERLVSVIAAGSDEDNAGEARKRLIEGHLILALALAKDFRDKGIPASDLVQEANLALTMAVSEYREGDFLLFVRGRILEAVQELLSEQQMEQKVEEQMLARVNVLQDVSTKMAEELGREATVEELAQRMQMSTDEIREIMKMAVDALNVVGE